MRYFYLILMITLISGCGVAYEMEQWKRETETFDQLDAAYKAGKLSEKEYFELKARLMNKGIEVNHNN